MMSLKEYQQGLKFLFIIAIKRLYKGEVFILNSIDHGIQTKIEASINITEDEIPNIKKEMDNLINRNLPITKKIISKKDAYDFYIRHNEIEKAENVLKISNISVSMFELDGEYNYFYSSEMPESTGLLKGYDLYYVKPNQIVISYTMNGKMDFKFRNNIFETYDNSRNWAKKIHIEYVSDINNLIAKGKMDDLIRKCDLLMDVEIYLACQKIIASEKKIVLLAGPSSSGKTTTSRKLANALGSIGIEARAITLDDYFLENDEAPLLPDGSKDYESLKSLDLDLFNKHIETLLNGGEAKLPVYNFVLGMKEYPNPPIKLEENEVIIIEGLHGINPNLFYKKELANDAFKIYISPFSPLRIDRHNYISSTDNRLLRRIARDFRTRGKSAEASLESWSKVREGEEKYIFPYTDSVDYIINTSGIYEIGILKVMVEPLLYNVDFDSPCYKEARRLLDSLRCFYPISSEYVSQSAVLREFIGGSIFEGDVT